MTLLEELQTEKLAKEKQLNELEAALKSLQEQLARLGVTPKIPVEAEIGVPTWKKYIPYIIGGGVVASIIYWIFKK